MLPGLGKCKQEGVPVSEAMQDLLLGIHDVVVKEENKEPVIWITCDCTEEISIKWTRNNAGHIAVNITHDGFNSTGVRYEPNVTISPQLAAIDL
jgi:hypothetical protein